jgi:hypothetical protein
MNFQNNRQQEPSLRPLSNANDYSVLLVKKLRKPISILFCVIAFQLLFGNLTLRTYWRGTSTDPRSATYCRVISVAGERFETDSYVPLVWTVKPESTLADFALREIKNLVP